MILRAIMVVFIRTCFIKRLTILIRTFIPGLFVSLMQRCDVESFREIRTVFDFRRRLARLRFFLPVSANCTPVFPADFLLFRERLSSQKAPQTAARGVRVSNLIRYIFKPCRDITILLRDRKSVV